MTTFRISLLDADTFDVTISTTLPDEAAMAVRKIVMDAALGTASPSVRAGLLMWRLSYLATVHDCTDKLEMSNKPDYSGYVITINLAGNHLRTEDFDNNGNTETVCFSELADWVTGPDYDGYCVCDECGEIARYCSCHD